MLRKQSYVGTNMNTNRLKELRKLNFQNLIYINVPNIFDYTFDEYRKNDYEHKPIVGYCTSCEKKDYHLSMGDDTYKLTKISHGAHSYDFLKALKVSIDSSAWHNEPIMFVYEAPGRGYKDQYKEIFFEKCNKWPTKQWYWIHGDKEYIAYPKGFWRGEYGGFVLSTIITFKLSNVYMTNLVKCSLNNNNWKSKGIQFYNEKTIQNCYSQFLEKEIAIIKPRIIFAVGSAVERWVKWFVKDLYYVQQLPHPAGRWRGDHFKAICFWKIVRALFKVGIINLDDGAELAKIYLDKYDEMR